MGALRLLLALLVVYAHAGRSTETVQWLFGHAVFAVRAFFVISGLYMAMILTERYQASISGFYASRILKLLPIYWVVGFLMVAVQLYFDSGIINTYLPSTPAAWSKIDLSTIPLMTSAYIMVASVFLIGSDTAVWLGFHPTTGAWSTTPAYAPNAMSLLSVMPVPQAWTLGLELTFYLVAPLVVRRSLLLILLLIGGSLWFRLWAEHNGLGGVPWNRSLFASEAVFFLLGVVSYRAIRIVRPLHPRLCMGIAVLCVSVVVYCRSQPLDHSSNEPIGAIWAIQYAAVAASLPFLFLATARSRLDEWLGALTYPVYMVHYFVLSLLALLSPSLYQAGGVNWVVACTVSTLVAALALDMLVARPIDRLRVNFGARPRTADLMTGECAPSPVLGRKLISASG